MAAGDKKTVVMKVCGKVPDAEGNVSPTAADVRAAPGGFGLGERGKQLTSADDLNNIWENGWYWWGSSTPQNAPNMAPNGGAAYVFMRVTNYDSKNVLQEYWSLNQDAQNQARRINRGGTWGQLEWYNPPMLLGVEYRTVERCQRKPVYKMLVDFGALPNNGNKEATWGTTADRPISCEAYTVHTERDRYQVLNGITPLSAVGSSSADVYMTAFYDQDFTIPRIYARTTVEASVYHAYALVKYIKITD